MYPHDGTVPVYDSEFEIKSTSNTTTAATGSNDNDNDDDDDDCTERQLDNIIPIALYTDVLQPRW